MDQYRSVLLDKEVPEMWSHEYAGGQYTVVWEGRLPVKILPSDNHHTSGRCRLFVTRLTFCNNGTDVLEDIYYNRNVDPDNDQPWSGDFTTNNIIVFSLLWMTGPWLHPKV